MKLDTIYSLLYAPSYIGYISLHGAYYGLIWSDGGRVELGPGPAFFTTTLLELPNMMFWRKKNLMILRKFGQRPLLGKLL